MAPEGGVVSRRREESALAIRGHDILVVDAEVESMSKRPPAPGF